MISLDETKAKYKKGLIFQHSIQYFMQYCYFYKIISIGTILQLSALSNLSDH